MIRLLTSPAFYVVEVHEMLEIISYRLTSTSQSCFTAWQSFHSQLQQIQTICRAESQGQLTNVERMIDMRRPLEVKGATWAVGCSTRELGTRKWPTQHTPISVHARDPLTFVNSTITQSIFHG